MKPDLGLSLDPDLGRDAYFAGLIDGEGSFTIQVDFRDHKGRPSVRVNPRMCMSLKYGREVLDALAERFGGQVYRYEKESRWNLSRRAALIAACEALMPHLVIKLDICERFLEALRAWPERADHGSGARTWDYADALRIAEVAWSLNPGGRGHTRTPEQMRSELRLIYGEAAAA